MEEIDQEKVLKVYDALQNTIAEHLNNETINECYDAIKWVTACSIFTSSMLNKHSLEDELNYAIEDIKKYITLSIKNMDLS